LTDPRQELIKGKSDNGCVFHPCQPFPQGAGMRANRVCGDGAFFKVFSSGVFSCSAPALAGLVGISRAKAKPYSVEHRSIYHYHLCSGPFLLTDHRQELIKGKSDPAYAGQPGCRDYSKNNYIEQFFVGLLEGDGTITTNINSSKTIRVRIVIALKNEINNHIMLNKIQNIIGGRVIIERKEKYVT
jgi:hypothetical protein